MDRIINVKVSGNYLSKDNKNAGVRGEANVTKLRITFDEDWDGYAKTVTFFNAYGNNPVKRIETVDLLEDITKDTRTYITPIPKEAMAIAGKLTFVVDGFYGEFVKNDAGEYEVVYEGASRRQRSISDTLVVKDAPIADDAGKPTDPTPTPPEQWQMQVDKLKENICDAVIARDEAVQSAAKAKEAVGKTSYIGENGNWYAWDGEKCEFYDTGIKAQPSSIVYCGDTPPDNADIWINPDSNRCIDISDTYRQGHEKEIGWYKFATCKVIGALVRSEALFYITNRNAGEKIMALIGIIVCQAKDGFEDISIVQLGGNDMSSTSKIEARYNSETSSLDFYIYKPGQYQLYNITRLNYGANPREIFIEPVEDNVVYKTLPGELKGQLAYSKNPYDIKWLSNGSAPYSIQQEGSMATGTLACAKGYDTFASGYGANSEGGHTKSLAYYTHAEGYHTIAKSNYQHVEGKFNIEDADSRYVHIVGNGKSDANRSNAHTLDWEGNAWFAGNVICNNVILKSPNGSLFEISVSDDGVLSATSYTEN